MSRSWRTGQFDNEEQEPLGPLANLIDIMLVFACGLIAALVALSPELSQHFNVTQQSSPKTIQAVDSVGKELTSTPEALKEKLNSQEGFQAMGQVYKDPKTGKLILISNK